MNRRPIGRRWSSVPGDVWVQLPSVIFTPLTTSDRGLSLHVEVEPTPETGLDETSYVQCELIRSINHKRLVHRLGAVGPSISTSAASIIKTLLNY